MVYITLPTEIIQLILQYLPFEELVAFDIDFEFIVHKKYNPNLHTWRWAARNGHLEVLEWLHLNRKIGYDEDVIAYAACNGHLHAVKFLHENKTELCTRNNAMNWAAGYGHLEVVKWLYFNSTEVRTWEAINYAARNGRLDIVKWLYFNSKVCPYLKREVCIEHAIKSAACEGYMEVVKWLQDESGLNVDFECLEDFKLSDRYCR